MSLYYQDERVKIIHGDCVEAMAEMDENSVDAICTDPPYGLEFMGKEWDRLLMADRHTDNPRCRHSHGPNAYVAGLQAQLWHTQWATQALRVLKPGGYLLAFGGTRTQHRLVCGLEDAGFEIRDTICWLYGSGFPKNYRVQLGVHQLLPRGVVCQCDANKHNTENTVPVLGILDHIRKVGLSCEAVDVDANGLNGLDRCLDCLARCLSYHHQDDESPRLLSRGVQTIARLQGYAQGHSHWHEHEDGLGSESLHSPSQAQYNALLSKLDCSLPEPLENALQLLQAYVDESSLEVNSSTNESKLGDFEAELGLMIYDRLASCTQHICNLVACLPLSVLQCSTPEYDTIIPHLKLCVKCGKVLFDSGIGTALKPAFEPIVVARKPLSEKNVASNVLKWGTGGINVDECRIESPVLDSERRTSKPGGGRGGIFMPHGDIPAGERHNPQGRWPSNVILECTCEEVIEGAEIHSGNFPKSRGEATHRGTSYKLPEKVGSEPRSVIDKAVIHTDPNCPCKMLDEQSGETVSSDRVRQNKAARVWSEDGGWKPVNTLGHSDSGGASRFFFCPKASSKERGKGNIHPTCKPIQLMEYLLKLVSRPEAVILDPFAGSMTTVLAAVALGLKCIAIEQGKEYCEMLKGRCVQISMDLKL